MSIQEKNAKMSKLLRSKAQEFLSSRKSSHILEEIVRHFNSGSDVNSCLLALELIFTTLLKDRHMRIEITPFKPVQHTPENQYKEWLQNTYEECFSKILCCADHPSNKVQIQSFTTAMNLLSYEGKFPLEQKGCLESYVPLGKLKATLLKMLTGNKNTSNLIKKFEEYLEYNDMLFFTWKVLPSITAKSNPNDIYIMNYLNLLDKMHVEENESKNCLCYGNEGDVFSYDENVTKKCLNKVWSCMVRWEPSSSTHKELLAVLLEKILPHLDKPLLLTDFLMDSLDVGGAVSLLALQGIFTLIQKYNLEYPNIYGKLYSMFEPEIFHTKYKARLFQLADLFLSSTHLPESLVAAFVKRMARLALLAPSEDTIVICRFIGNLILRHPGLKVLIDHPTGGTTSSDPYLMDESDPMKSNAINSSLWELKTLQHHMIPNVASAARFIDNPLPKVEWDLNEALNSTSDDIFDKELKRNSRLITLAISKPNPNEIDKFAQFWEL
ncbi:nucleolar complex protein 4 homolog A [Agrilus planipennis]|uniref:Nucleolar complex protein 4 homolog A n=1 Tax=Agrilus planipennis TaxID=224129 RepID=A0A1W4WU83_AGRPL|nr:nucleolar complex protein 4 homolog A [Agrilus planipennis]